MTDTPKIGGRFEFEPTTQTLEVWFTTGAHYVLGPEADFDKTLRGQVPISLTGGAATLKSKLTWSEQLAGKMETEAARIVRPKRYDHRGRLEVSLADLDLGSLLADFTKGPSNDDQATDGSDSSTAVPSND